MPFVTASIIWSTVAIRLSRFGTAMSTLLSRAQNALGKHLGPGPSQPLDLIFFVAQPTFELLDRPRLFLEGFLGRLRRLFQKADLDAFFADLKRPDPSQQRLDRGANDHAERSAQWAATYARVPAAMRSF